MSAGFAEAARSIPASIPTHPKMAATIDLESRVDLARRMASRCRNANIL